MSLVKPGMDLGGAVYHGLVISKHLTYLDNWYPEVSKGMAEINNLLDSGPGSHKLGPIGSCFDRCLFLGEPIDRGAVDKV